MVGLIPGGASPYWSPGIARQKGLESLLMGNSVALGNDFTASALPKFDWQKLAQQQEMTNYQNSLSSLIPVSQTPGGQFSAADLNQIRNSVLQSDNPINPRLGALLRALGAQESGNRYGARNPSGAMGRWQVMPSNILGPGGWDREAIGRNVSVQQFMSSPEIQNAIVRYKFGQYLRKYGAKGALSAWYSGDPNRWKSGGGGGGGYPSVYNYVMQVLNRL